jgi:protein-disulfide isomerase
VLWLGGTAAAVLVIAAIVWAVLPHNPGPPSPSVPEVPADIPRGVTGAGDPYLGSPRAPVTMDEYGDFQCPFCGDFARTTEQLIISTYVARGKVRVVWHTMAFIGQESVWAGEAARCAQDQGKFWDFYMVLYTHQGAENSGAFAPKRLADLARLAHLDTAAFTVCFQSHRYLQAIRSGNQQAAKQGIQTTPTFFIDGRKVVGALPFSQMAPLIDAALAQHH